MRHFWDASKTWRVLFELFHQSSVVSRQDLYVLFLQVKKGNLMKESWNISSICHQSYVFSISIRFEMFLCICRQFAFFYAECITWTYFFSICQVYWWWVVSLQWICIQSSWDFFIFTFYFASRFCWENMLWYLQPFQFEIPIKLHDLKFRCVFIPHADQFYRDSINFSNIYTILMGMLQYVFFW